MCDFNSNKTNFDLKKGTLLNDYILLKINDMISKTKEEITILSKEIMKKINSTFSIESELDSESINDYIYKLLLLNDNIDINVSEKEMLEYIFDNNIKYILIYDSTNYEIPIRDNVIVFDINNSLLTEEYNIFINNSKLKNININIINDNFNEYWPINIEKSYLYNLINNNFFNILNKKKIITSDDNMAIFSKLIDSFYNTNITTNYVGYNNSVKSFLSSNLKI